ncbi:MAG: hypothetical protein HYY16_15530 [Planctomycetes bacterium]|nr:hypothetical protein [Planctomycetota bacterium]
MKKVCTALLLLPAMAPALYAQHSKDKVAQNGVIWATSWEEALQEAQARNVPIHFTVHKDN